MTDFVWIDGTRHQVVDTATLENLAWPAFDIHLPIGRGWATTRAGSARFACWLEAGQEAAL